ncbi:MAG: acetyl-CoA carboxylase, carboxyltransferase subunit beta [Candidatus Auribacterota bacterium]|jgi:acetyl-CoA carboxylase carboxyl transferase subunit beta|nr:acetyl-CoA carboxylase, carboxyltransferase subunit beta [Candidatus Auribacterota bacterium]
MSLFGRPKYSKILIKKKDIPQGLWEKCKSCQEIIHKTQLEENLMTCPKCNFLYPLSSAKRIASLIEEGTFVELDKTMRSADPLEFLDSKPYSIRQEQTIKKTGLNDAVITGTGKINSLPVALGVMDFDFMGGSMGSVVGEKITRLIEHAIEKSLPVIIVSASGGARMQESTLSLMQMAKTSAALGRLRMKNLPFISVLTNPTTGGTTASFASLGDVIIAEPKALIGFAGPRVIQQTIKQELPDGFQRSEFLLDHGLIDMIVERKDIKETIHFTLDFFMSGKKKSSDNGNGKGELRELVGAHALV